MLCYMILYYIISYYIMSSYSSTMQDFFRFSPKRLQTISSGVHLPWPSPHLGDSKNTARGYCLDIPRFK